MMCKLVTQQRSQLTMMVVMAIVAIVSGCSRSLYRRQADREAHYLIREKSLGTPWEIPDSYTIQPDVRSRFFDPTDPDFPTLPPAGPNLYQYRLPELTHRGAGQLEMLPPTAPHPAVEPGELPSPPLPPRAAAGIGPDVHERPFASRVARRNPTGILLSAGAQGSTAGSWDRRGR